MLHNDSIKLRAIEPEDLDLLYIWENNTDIWEVSNSIVPLSRYLLKQYIESDTSDLYTTKQLRLVIELIDEKKEIGLIDLYDFDPFHKRAGIGILIHLLSERSKGYASDALRLLTEYAFDFLNLNQLYCEISEENIPSLKLFENQGFKTIGKKEAWNRIGAIYKGVYFLQKIKP